MGFGTWGLGFRVWDLGFRAQSLGFGVRGKGQGKGVFGLQGLDSGFRVSGSGRLLKTGALRECRDM